MHVIRATLEDSNLGKLVESYRIRTDLLVLADEASMEAHHRWGPLYSLLEARKKGEDHLRMRNESSI